MNYSDKFQLFNFFVQDAYRLSTRFFNEIVSIEENFYKICHYMMWPLILRLKYEIEIQSCHTENFKECMHHIFEKRKKNISSFSSETHLIAYLFLNSSFQPISMFYLSYFNLTYIVLINRNLHSDYFFSPVVLLII